MTVRYKGGSQYVCNHLRQQHGTPVCQCLRSAAIDASVAAAFLAAVAPAEIDAWARARKAQRPADETLGNQPSAWRPAPEPRPAGSPTGRRSWHLQQADDLAEKRQI